MSGISKKFGLREGFPLAYTVLRMISRIVPLSYVSWIKEETIRENMVSAKFCGVNVS